MTASPIFLTYTRLGRGCVPEAEMHQDLWIVTDMLNFLLGL